jgi:hypothetical protein
LLKKICWNHLGFDERVHEAGHFFKILGFYFLFPPQHQADDRFHQNYYFTIFSKHQTIDLVKKNCWNRSGSDERFNLTKLCFMDLFIGTWAISTNFFNQIYSLMFVKDSKNSNFDKNGHQLDAEEEVENKIQGFWRNFQLRGLVRQNLSDSNNFF